MIRILFCGLGGVLSACVGCRWAEILLSKRGRDYTLTSDRERLLCLLASVPGLLIGVLTESYALSLYGLVLLGICVTASVTDWMHRLIPNPTVLAVFAVTLVFGIPSLLGMEGFPVFHIGRSLLGMAGCFVVFMAPGFFGRKVGAGDVKLAASVGFLLGIEGALVAIIIMGFMVLGYSLVQRRMPILAFLKTNIPMGPFITAGMLVSFLQIASTL